MAKQYETEIKKIFEKQYLKCFLKSLDNISILKSLLDQLPTVAKVNITHSDSMYSLSQNLTIYPKKLVEIEEMKMEVDIKLEEYFSGGTSDPVFIPDPIPAIGDAAYFKILDKIIQLGMNLEKIPDVVRSLDEEGIRDYFLPYLNSISKTHSATGETFNKKGRTDILIQDDLGHNVFIAECKLWDGQSYLNDGIDQLLERYVSWRDEKTALLIFNKDVSGFSEIIDKALQTVKNHQNCYSFIEKRKDTSFSYIFNQIEDRKKKIKLELILFNFK
jgi:hypothetical protein